MSFRVWVGSMRVEVDTAEELFALLSYLGYERERVAIGTELSAATAVEKPAEKLPIASGEALDRFLRSLPKETLRLLKILASQSTVHRREEVARELGLPEIKVSRIIAGLTKRAKSVGLPRAVEAKRVWEGGRVSYVYLIDEAIRARLSASNS